MTSKKKLSAKVFPIAIGIIVGMAIGITVGYLIFHQKISAFTDVAIRPPVGGDVELEEGKKSLKAYRDDGSMLSLSLYKKHKMSGLLHDTASMIRLYNKFEDFRRSHYVRPGYEWGMGLYANIIRDSKRNNVPRLNVYFIPTMFDSTDSNKVLDYFSHDSDTCYTKPIPGSSWKLKDSYIYDQGTMFP